MDERVFIYLINIKLYVLGIRIDIIKIFFIFNGRCVVRYILFDNFKCIMI